MNKNDDTYLHVSALSIIGCACETSPLALSTWFRDIVNCSLDILDTQKKAEIRRGIVIIGWLYLILFKKKSKNFIKT